MLSEGRNDVWVHIVLVDTLRRTETRKNYSTVPSSGRTVVDRAVQVFRATLVRS